jgi:hypothetical protein
MPRELTTPLRVTIWVFCTPQFLVRTGKSSHVQARWFVTISRESSHVKHVGAVTICWGIVTREARACSEAVPRSIPNPRTWGSTVTCDDLGGEIVTRAVTIEEIQGVTEHGH